MCARQQKMANLPYHLCGTDGRTKNQICYITKKNICVCLWHVNVHIQNVRLQHIRKATTQKYFLRLPCYSQFSFNIILIQAAYFLETLHEMLTVLSPPHNFAKSSFWYYWREEVNKHKDGVTAKSVLYKLNFTKIRQYMSMILMPIIEWQVPIMMVWR